MKLVFATHNSGKVDEMKMILQGLDVKILSLMDVGITEDIIEDGDTFEENALIKARYANDKTGLWSFADDSGLCVQVLNGAPGVHTARWGGEGVVGQGLVDFSLERMKDIPEGQRQAYFQSSVGVISPEGREWTFSGKTYGTITTKPRGELVPKLPYDVVFIPDGFDKTFAQMPKGEKNKISHRGKSFEQLKNFLQTQLDLS